MSKVKLHSVNGVTVLSSKVLIEAPKEKVWDTLKSVGEIEKFHPLVKKSCTIGNKPSGLGAKRQCELLPMGQMNEEVVEWKEGHTIVMAVTGGKMLPPYLFMKGKIDLRAMDNQTLVNFEFMYQLKYGHLGKLMNWLMILPQFKKAPPQYVNGLKEYVENH